MFYAVYKITNLINKKIYVGVHKTKHLDDDYMGSGKLIKRSIEKYGVEHFEKEYIEIFNNSEQMFAMESEIVNESFLKRSDTYNLKVGGFGGWDYLNNPELFDNPTHSKEHMKLMNKAGSKKGSDKLKWLSTNDKDWVEKHSKSISNVLNEHYKNNHGNFTGKQHTDETKQKMSEKAKIHSRGKGNSQYGTCWIHSLEEKCSKKIQKNDLINWINIGWIKGRKLKF